MATHAHPLVVVGLLAAAGCASSGSTQVSDLSEAPAAAQSRNSSVITPEEIAATNMSNMEEVIQRLRPQYLRTRGRTSINLVSDQVAVYMDDVHMGSVSVLSQIGTNGVKRVEYVRGPDTGFKFGLNHQAGVIHIISK
jgi:outer membrane receptor protein involved in Fe transport